MMRLTPLVVVAANELLLEGLRRILGRSRFRISAHYSSLRDLGECVVDPDIGALVVNLEQRPAVEDADIDRIRESFPNAKLILMSELDECAGLMHICENADGLVLRSSGAAAIVKALELIVLGERIVPMAAFRRRVSSPSNEKSNAALADPGPPEDEEDVEVGTSGELPVRMLGRWNTLSERELEVADLLCQASPNKVIARQLGISEATVKVHVKSILRKTNARNRTEAALMMSSVGASPSA